MGTFITTAAVPGSDVPSFWNEISKKYFVELKCSLGSRLAHSASTSFQASLSHNALGNLDLIDLRATPHAVQRANNHTQSEEFFILSLLTEGVCDLSQNDRMCRVYPGQLVLYDTRSEYKVELLETFRMCSIRIPVDTMRLYSPAASNAVALPIDTMTGIGRIISNLMLNIFEEKESSPDIKMDDLAKPLLEMLSIGLDGVCGVNEKPNSRLSNYHAGRVRQFIEDNLYDPGLTVDAVATALKMSLSSVHRAFVHQPLSVGEFIVRRRIEACQQDLISPVTANRLISDIAYDWGFSSNAHFSRAFKKYTGLSPREYRSLHSQGTQEAGKKTPLKPVLPREHL
ncbi:MULTISPECIES: helix-turn-helix domain-containing protein [Pseudomonas]|jgi:AraC-like DNA-binding protein|uniref:Helix-turn-helix domain-containing protein n=2 Tax=Pseudomonas TaxID=286 RepID=A0ABZ2JKI0_9PSED|nr:MULTISPECIES: helix-turn-helix domain-containing protein [Pseudomonas]MBA6123431.1 helix-turn-helix domain-containing protein [Pseudomonas juntendi]MBH3371956.1 helix-turn-helix domain-containing protein [Pseudomonas juntendi]MBI6916853.1 helix-turn-helix domain-containing protein [Pseudomonas juntendi]MBS6038213.1 helix-turn-helix domain-containing protein [Pseudomonas sp.]MCF3158776.1 helix-turn-helix domain-containing protein [Pseudomonas juntendi]